jgi:hypothetical protein
MSIDPKWNVLQFVQVEIDKTLLPACPLPVTCTVAVLSEWFAPSPVHAEQIVLTFMACENVTVTVSPSSILPGVGVAVVPWFASTRLVIDGGPTVGVGVLVAVAVGVLVGVAVGVLVAVGVGVLVGVAVAVGVLVTVGVAVGVLVGVAGDTAFVKSLVAVQLVL